MTKQQHNSFIPISKTALEELTKEVKETIAMDIAVRQEKIFSSADLWNLHRNKRKVAIRKFIV